MALRSTIPRRPAITWTIAQDELIPAVRSIALARPPISTPARSAPSPGGTRKNPPMMSAESIAKALGGRETGGGWTACCPAHDDRTPSLSIRDADGKVLVRCHAGCDQEQVIATLRSLDLWTENGSR